MGGFDDKVTTASRSGRMEVSSFGGNGFDGAGRTRRFFSAGRDPRARRPSNGGASSMLIKLGVCCAAAALVLLVKLASDNGGSVAVSEQGAGVLDTLPGQDDRLGSLTFVELPGIIEVFAQSEEAALEMAAEAFEYDEANLVLKLISAGEQNVLLNASCSVASAESDALYGTRLVLRLAGDTELTLLGLNEINGERGQRMSAGDTVGSIGAEQLLYVSATEKGRPVEPVGFVNAGDACARDGGADK